MPASIYSVIWRKDGSRRRVWHLLIFATLLLCVSASNDSEIREGVVLEHVAVDPQHALEKDNGFVATHVEWVVDLSHNQIQPDSEPSAASLIQTATAGNSPDSLVTSAPYLCDCAVLRRLEERQVPSALGVDCNSQLSSARANDVRVLSATVSNLQREKSQGISEAQAVQTAAQQAQSSAQVLQSIAQSNADDASSAAAAANSSLTSLSSSACSAVSVASASVIAVLSSASSASAAAASALASASMAMAMATASASSLIASAQGSASAAISSAQVGASKSIAAAQASAASDVSDARATATFALQQAKETISSAALQAAATIRASQVQAITATQIAIAIVVSVTGSFLISILVYFLLIRYKKRRANRKPGSTISNHGFTTGDMKVGRNSMDTERRISNPELGDHRSAQGELEENISLSDFPLPGGRPDKLKRFEWSFGSTAQETEQFEPILKPTMSRKTVLVYDPGDPMRPPAFVSELNGSLSTVSPFGSFRISKEIKTDKNLEELKFDASA